MDRKVLVALNTVIEQNSPASRDDVTVQREVEVKLLADPGVLKGLLTLPQLSGARMQPRAKTLVTAYFDTEDRTLESAGVMLRVRRNYGRHVMTVKFPPDMTTGLFGRQEIEVRLPGSEPDINLLNPEIAIRLQQITHGRPLEQVYASNFRRQIGLLDTGRAKIELCIDSGLMEAGEKQQPLNELELELKQGDEEVLCELAASLVASAQLRLGPLSKGERGVLLANGTAAQSIKGKVPALPAAIIMDDFLAIVIDLCLKQFIGNWPAIEAASTPEGVHQARVALRRLRAMLGLFARQIPSTELQVFRAEAKQLASALGPARDWDVFIELVEQGPLSLYARDSSFEALLAAARVRRDQSYAGAMKVIQDPATSIFVLKMRAYAARRGWRTALSADQLPLLTQPARTYAMTTLGRLHKKAMKQGRRLADLNVEERHDLRIDLKKIRYAAEFFGPLFARSAGQKRYTKGAGGLQDVLGAFNDEAVAHELLNALEADAGAAVSRAAGVVQGWCGRGRVDADGLLKQAWEKFEQAKRFWG